MSGLNVIPIESLPELEDLQGAELAIVVKDNIPYRATLVNVAGQLGSSLWEADGVNTIKPKNEKTVDGSHLSGQITGGIFQP